MFQSKFNRLIVAGLATAVVVPSAAVARVATDQVATPQTQDLRARRLVAVEQMGLVQLVKHRMSP